MNFLASFIRIAIFIGILYLIFTNFGLFLAIIGGIVLFFIIIIYFVKRALRKRAQQFQFEFNRFTREDYNNFDFKNFNNFNNQNFQGNFYNKGSKLQEAKEGFNVPTVIMLNKNKESIKDHYVEDGFSNYIRKQNLEEDFDKVIKKYI